MMTWAMRLMDRNRLARSSRQGDTVVHKAALAGVEGQVGLHGGQGVAVGAEEGGTEKAEEAEVGRCKGPEVGPDKGAGLTEGGVFLLEGAALPDSVVLLDRSVLANAVFQRTGC